MSVVSPLRAYFGKSAPGLQQSRGHCVNCFFASCLILGARKRHSSILVLNGPEETSDYVRCFFASCFPNTKIKCHAEIFVPSFLSIMPMLIDICSRGGHHQICMMCHQYFFFALKHLFFIFSSFPPFEDGGELAHSVPHSIFLN